MITCRTPSSVVSTCRTPTLVAPACRVPVNVFGPGPGGLDMSARIDAPPQLQVGGAYSDAQFIQCVHTTNILTMSSQTGQGLGIDNNNWSGVGALYTYVTSTPPDLEIDGTLIWRRYGSTPPVSPGPALSFPISAVVNINYALKYFLRLRVVNWINETLFLQTILLNP